MGHSARLQEDESEAFDDEFLFGWNPTPGIVSVWADRRGTALLWRREGKLVTCTRERFRPWLVATTLEDLAHLRSPVLPASTSGSAQAAITYRELDGPEGSYRYLLSAPDGRLLERALVAGATRRLGREVKRVSELEDAYYGVGPCIGYLGHPFKKEGLGDGEKPSSSACKHRWVGVQSEVVISRLMLE